MSACIFCKIVNKELPAEVIFEDETLMVFRDINPKAPIHFLIIPKEHKESLNSLEEKDFYLVEEIVRLAQKLAKDHKIAASGYRLVTNSGPDSGQEVDHLHFHLLGGETLGSLA